MAKTLLAVDDSVTMRKVLEITFSGEDFRVITADTSQSALGKLGENPQVFVVDTVLGGEDGYALAKELRRQRPQAPIIMLASRYTPYDQVRGREAGADDWADKPFDTQQLIDKVRKVMLAKESVGGTPQMGGPAPSPGLYRAPAPPASAPLAPMGRGTQPSLGGAVPRTGTLVFGDQHLPPPTPMSPPRPQGPPPMPAHAAPAAPTAHGPAAHAPHGPSPVAAPALRTPPPPPPAAAAAHAGATVNGHLAPKLGELGLSPQQADAVLALSRDVVERVVWEVVPQLAEALIKEEIARLTRD